MKNGRPCFPHARLYASIGLPVLALWWPKDDGTCACPRGADCPHPGKHPIHSGGCNGATTDEGLLIEWWRWHPEANVGIATGGDLNLVVLDVDPRHGGDESLQRLEDEIGEIPDTFIVDTGSGGEHFYFTGTNGARFSSTADVNDYAGLDVKADGGYVVAAPSRHTSGGTYRLRNTESDIVDIPPAWADFLPKKQDRGPSQEPNFLPEEADSTPYGANALRENLAAVATATEGARHKAMMKYTFKTAQLVAGGEIQGAGVRGQFLRDALATGIDEQEAENGVTQAWGKGLLEPRSPPEMDEGPPLVPRADRNPPLPLDSGSAPPWPRGAFPPWLEHWVDCVAEALQVPRGLVAMMALGAISAAVARKFRVQLAPGYDQPLNIYGMVILEPGNRKSAATKLARQPIADHQRKLRDEARPKIATAKGRKQLLETELKALKGRAAKDPSLGPDVVRLAARLASFEVPKSPRLFVDDITPEALGQMIADQGGLLAVIDAEGGLLENIAGRYERGGTPNINLVLKAYEGEDTDTDRISRESVFVENPCLVLVVAVQSEVLRALADKKAIRGKGLMGRFVFWLPDSPMGQRKISPPPIPDEVQDEYEGNLRRLLEQDATAPPLEGADSNVISLSHERTLVLSNGARLNWTAFAEWIEPQLSDFGDLGYMKDWGGKIAGTTGRFAALLHLAEHAGDPRPEDTPLSAETMARAIELGECLVEHAKRAFGAMRADPVREGARHILKLIKSQGWQSFTKRDVHRQAQTKFEEADKIDPCLRRLEELGWIWPVDPPDNTGPGRKPSPRYEVHGLILSQSDPEIGGGCDKSTPDGERS